MAIDNFKLDPNAAGISKDVFDAHTHNYRKVTRIGVDESKAWLSPTFEDVIDNGDTVAVGLNDIEGAALTTATAKTGMPPGKWSGLGIVLIAIDETTEEYDAKLDTLLANEFTVIRECPDFSNEYWYPRSKAAVIRGIAKGADYIWGVSFDNTITSSNWSAYVIAVEAAALWAQNNGVYEFQIGNEAEMFVDGTTMTVTQLITNLKSLAIEVKAIFTNGNVSYSCWQESINDWVSAGKGDLDLLACNIYKTYSTEPLDVAWKAKIDALVGEFGVDGTYLTEFSLNVTDIDYYSEDESVQAAAVTEMIDYIKASGMTRACYFLWYHPSFNMGVIKDDDTYRLLWYSLLNSG